jgi:hypothetical protein
MRYLRIFLAHSGFRNVKPWSQYSVTNNQLILVALISYKLRSGLLIGSNVKNSIYLIYYFLTLTPLSRPDPTYNACFSSIYCLFFIVFQNEAYLKINFHSV